MVPVVPATSSLPPARRLPLALQGRRPEQAHQQRADARLQQRGLPEGGPQAQGPALLPAALPPDL
eukprot:15436244-Alexandrium_andersonii.AAC.1